MRPAALPFLLFAGLAAAAGARADGGAAIALRAGADLPGTRYTLGDIADIETADAGLQRRLAAIPIGTVPRQGYAESVSRAQVEALVRREVAPAMLAWRGAPEVRIRGRGQRLAADRLHDAAVPALYAALAADFDAIEMQPASGFDGIDVPAGKLRLAARVPASQRPARRMSALVDVSVDGAVYTTVPVWFSVRASRPALLARVPLRPGAPVRAGDFQVQTVDVAATAAPALRGNAPLEGLQLRRAIEPGMVLSAAHVEQRPSVARDEQVVVRVVQGTVTIETTGRALSDARVGEVIKVRGAGSGDPYPARVVGDGVVLAGGR